MIILSLKTDIIKKPYNIIITIIIKLIIRLFNDIGFQGKNNHTKEDLVVNLIGETVDSWDSFHQIFTKILQNGTYKLDEKINCGACGQNDLQPDNRFHCLKCKGTALCSKCIPTHQSHKLFPIKSNTAYSCDGCSGIIIEGSIFRCSDCTEDYDLCPECYNQQIETKPHKNNHKLVKISLPIRLKNK